MSREEARRRVLHALGLTVLVYGVYALGLRVVPVAGDFLGVALIASFYVLPARMTRDIPELVASDGIVHDRLLPVWDWRGFRFALVAGLVVFPAFVLGFWWFYWAMCTGKLDELGNLGMAGLEFDGGLRAFFRGLCRHHGSSFFPEQLRIPASWAAMGGLGFIYQVLTGVFTIALPEELFHRAYIMGAMERLWPARFRVFGVPMGLAVIVSSAVFAIGHLAVMGQASRLGPFFPALVFAWLWRKSGSLWAPTLFHAASNLLMDLLIASTFPRGVGS